MSKDYYDFIHTVNEKGIDYMVQINDEAINGLREKVKELSNIDYTQKITSKCLDRKLNLLLLEATAISLSIKVQLDNLDNYTKEDKEFRHNKLKDYEYAISSLYNRISNLRDTYINLGIVLNMLLKEIKISTLSIDEFISNSDYVKCILFKSIQYMDKNSDNPLSLDLKMEECRNYIYKSLLKMIEK